MSITNDYFQCALRLFLAFLLIGVSKSAVSEDAKADTAATGPPVPVASQGEGASRKEVLTLDQCLQKAIARSQQIKAEKHRLDVLSEQQDQLWWVPFSDIFLEGGLGFVTNKCADVTGGRVVGCDGENSAPTDYDWKGMDWGPTLHVKFGANLPIPTSNRFFKAKEALEEAYKAKEAMLSTIEHRIAFDVNRAFHGVVGAREMLYTISQGRKHLTKAKKKVEENLANQEGSDTQIDLLKLKVFESRLDAMQKQVEQIEKTSLAALRFLVGQKEGAPLNLPEDPQDLVQREIGELNDYKKTAVDHRPEFKALRHGIKALEAKVSTTKGAFAPEAAIFFRIGKGYTPGVDVREQVLDDNGDPVLDAEGNPTYKDGSIPFVWRDSYNYGGYPAFGLVLKVPLDLGINIHKVREAKAELKALLADQSYAMEGVLLEVETTYIEVTSVYETITALNKSKKVAKGWLNAAVQNHAIGLGSTKDLQDALKEYFSIMGELHQRIGEYNIAVAKLDKATGVILPN